MPPFNETADQPLAFKTLIYGQTKARKTLWACKFAELGFNVHIIQGDRNGAEIATILDKEAQSRINVIDVSPTSDNKTSLINFLTALSRAVANGTPFFYSEDTRTVYSNLSLAKRSNAPLWTFDINKLHAQNDLIVVDNLTNVARNLVAVYARNNNIDLADAARTEWDGYGWCGRAIVHFCETLIALKCPVILIGHEQTYVKYRTVKDGDKTKQIPESETVQAITTSGPNAAAVMHLFDPILLFTISPGKTTYINAERAQGRITGSRFLPPKEYNWEDMVPAKFYPHLRRPLPVWQPSEAVTWSKPE